MFPPEIAGFSFHGDAAGTDDSLAARFSTQCSEGPALVVGNHRSYFDPMVMNAATMAQGQPDTRSKRTNDSDEINAERGS